MRAAVLVVVLAAALAVLTGAVIADRATPARVIVTLPNGDRVDVTGARPLAPEPRRFP